MLKLRDVEWQKTTEKSSSMWIRVKSRESSSHMMVQFPGHSPPQSKQEPNFLFKTLKFLKMQPTWIQCMLPLHQKSVKEIISLMGDSKVYNLTFYLILL